MMPPLVALCAVLLLLMGLSLCGLLLLLLLRAPAPLGRGRMVPPWAMRVLLPLRRLLAPGSITTL